MSDPTQNTEPPICPACQEEIEDGDGSYFGDVLAHFRCMTEDDDGE